MPAYPNHADNSWGPDADIDLVEQAMQWGHAISLLLPAPWYFWACTTCEAYMTAHNVVSRLDQPCPRPTCLTYVEPTNGSGPWLCTRPLGHSGDHSPELSSPPASHELGGEKGQASMRCPHGDWPTHVVRRLPPAHFPSGLEIVAAACIACSWCTAVEINLTTPSSDLDP